jgi:hypothetical protein
MFTWKKPQQLLLVPAMLILGTLSLPAQSAVNYELDAYVFQMLRSYNEAGMPGLVKESTKCHKRAATERLDCVRFDMASRHMETVMAKRYNLRKEPYFATVAIEKRAKAHFDSVKFDAEKLPEHLKQMQLEMDKAVGQYMRPSNMGR